MYMYASCPPQLRYTSGTIAALCSLSVTSNLLKHMPALHCICTKANDIVSAVASENYKVNFACKGGLFHIYYSLCGRPVLRRYTNFIGDNAKELIKLVKVLLLYCLANHFTTGPLLPSALHYVAIQRCNGEVPKSEALPHSVLF